MNSTMNKHPAERPKKTYRCLQCFHTFPNPGRLNDHVATEHNRTMRLAELHPQTQQEAEEAAKHYNFD